MIFGAGDISPELAAMLERAGRTDLLEGFEIADEVLQAHASDAAEAHAEKSPEQCAAIGVYQALFDRKAPHNRLDPGTAPVSESDASHMITRVMLGQFEHAAKRDQVQHEQILKALTCHVGTLQDALSSAAKETATGANLDGLTDALTSAATAHTERMERATLHSAASVQSALSTLHADAVEAVRWSRYTLIPQIVGAASLLALAIRECLR